MAMQKANNLTYLNRDRGYRFTDRDPVMDFITKDITDSGWPLTYVAERSGVSRACLANWQNGKTKHPQNMTVEAVLKALGWSRNIIRSKGAR